MIHYHGTPITPRSVLMSMAGKHFCVSFGTTSKGDVDVCLAIGQSLLFDNGAFSIHTAGKTPNWDGFYRWLEPRIANPHFSIVPDVIDGDVDEQRDLLRQWPFPKQLAAPVWHMAQPIDFLLELANGGWGKICFGSSKNLWKIGTSAWETKCDEAFNALSRNGHLPWVHMLRGLSLCGKRWPFSSADSSTVAIRAGQFRLSERENCEWEYVARQIDAVQAPTDWQERPIQASLGELIA